MHLIRQYNCWSLRCSWSIACRRCSNYIFILSLTPGFNRLQKDNYKTRWKTLKFFDLLCLILEIWQYYGYSAVHYNTVVHITWQQQQLNGCHVLNWHISGSVQERHISSALAMELRLSCINPSIPYLHMWAMDCVFVRPFVGNDHKISVAKHKTAVSPLPTHWRYCSFAVSHRYEEYSVLLQLRRCWYSFIFRCSYPFVLLLQFSAS